MKRALDLTATILVAVAALVFLWNQGVGVFSKATPVDGPGRNSRIPTEPISINAAASVGTGTARVAVVEFADAQCPFCATFHQEIFPEIKKQYVDTGKAMFVFKHFPLPIHKLATRAGEAMECARLQNRFWEMADVLFVKPDALDDDGLIRNAVALKMNSADFSDCLASGRTRSTVENDVALAKQLELFATPTFLIGSIERDSRMTVRATITGARSFIEFATALDDVIRHGR